MIKGETLILNTKPSFLESPEASGNFLKQDPLHETTIQLSQSEREDLFKYFDLSSRRGKIFSFEFFVPSGQKVSAPIIKLEYLPRETFTTSMLNGYSADIVRVTTKLTREQLLQIEADNSETDLFGY